MKKKQKETDNAAFFAAEADKAERAQRVRWIEVCLSYQRCNDKRRAHGYWKKIMLFCYSLKDSWLF